MPQTNRLAYCVLGIGVNVEPPVGAFPADIANRAGAVLAQRGDGSARNRLAAAFLNAFWGLYTGLDTAPFAEEYRRRCLRLGREVQVLRGGEARPAQVITVTDALALRVQYADGTVEELTSGEVSIRPVLRGEG